MANKSTRESNEALRDTAGIHQLAHKDKERDRKEDKRVHPANNGNWNDQKLYIASGQKVNDTSQADGGRNGRVNRHQDDNHANQSDNQEARGYGHILSDYHQNGGQNDDPNG